MRKIALTLLLTFVAAFASAQMKSAVPRKAPAVKQKNPILVTGAKQAGQNSFPRISVADALKLYREGKAVFIDVRSSTQFGYSHITGALSIPRSQVITRWSEVPTQKTVITYCACGAEESSGSAAANLIAHGVKNVWALKGGINEWKTLGGPTAAGPK
jgi:rhodanese-related sulfurtransferase